MTDDWPALPAEYMERRRQEEADRQRLHNRIKRLIVDDYGVQIWLFIAGWVVGSVAVLALLGGGIALLSQRSCASEANGLGLSHRWGPLMGCLLKTPGGQYIPDSQYFINHPQP